MGIKSIPLTRLETDLRKTLDECADSGETFVVELPNDRLVAIHSLEPDDEDSLVDDLLASNSDFQALVTKSRAGARKPFPVEE